MYVPGMYVSTDAEGSAQVPNRHIQVQRLILCSDESSAAVEDRRIVAQCMDDNNFEADPQGSHGDTVQGLEQQLHKLTRPQADPSR